MIMKRQRDHTVVLLALLCLWAEQILAQAIEPNTPGSSVTAAVIPCEGMIDDGLFHSIKRRSELALDQDVKYLIYEIGTYGGLVQSADSISKYLIQDIGDRAQTIAYIKTQAISAGAMISVSCNDILMRENTTIGDCAPMVLGDKLEGVEREKSESFVRATFDRAARANDYPQALLRSMVSVQIEVYEVENKTTGKPEYFETKDLPSDPNLYALDAKKLVVEKDKLLTVDAAQAHAYGIARAVVKDVNGVLEFLAQRDNVDFTLPSLRLETNWSEEMVRMVNHPAVIGVLTMIALLGLYMEFNTPGLGLPGLAALICFAVIIGSKYLVGMANWVEVAVFVLGIVLVLLELFLFPGFGIAGLAGFACIVGGGLAMLVYNAPDSVPWPRTEFDWQYLQEGLQGIAMGFVGFMVAAIFLSKYLPHLWWLNRLVLVPKPASVTSGGLISMTAPTRAAGDPLQTGDIGTTVTTLRPAGRVRFGEKVVDSMTQGDFLDAGSQVEVLAIQGNRVVVKPTGRA